MSLRKPVLAGALSLSAAGALALAAPSALSQPNPAAQTPAPFPARAPAQPLQFEVATIKPVRISTGGATPGIKIYPNGRLVISAFSLKSLVRTAFHLGVWQLSGGEDWMGNREYDIVAQPPEDSPPTHYDLSFGWTRIEDPRLRQMLQALLLERFQLKIHRETKAGPIYLLVKSGKPVPLRAAEIPTSAETTGSEGIGTVGNAGDEWRIYNTSMQQFANFVGDYYLHRPILDQTGLAGYFNFRWKMVLSNADDDPQLGSEGELMGFIQVMDLKLQPSTGPVDTYVIDSAQPPSPN